MPTKLLVNKGDAYGRLTIVKELAPTSDSRRNRRRFLCKCSCNKRISITLESLRDNRTEVKSCGCYSKDNPSNYKHGLSKHPLYFVLSRMMERCYDNRHKNYNNYGGRGIKVCKEWRIKENYRGLKNFIAWNDSLPKRKRWVEGLEIDRKNNDKGYYTWNCQWLTKKDNLEKRVKKYSKFIEYDGKTYGMVEFWEKFRSNEVKLSTFIYRYKHGWKPYIAATKKVYHA
jgi:hypothetical protein